MTYDLQKYQKDWNAFIKEGHFGLKPGDDPIDAFTESGAVRENPIPWGPNSFGNYEKLLWFLDKKHDLDWIDLQAHQAHQAQGWLTSTEDLTYIGVVIGLLGAFGYTYTRDRKAVPPPTDPSSPSPRAEAAARAAEAAARAARREAEDRQRQEATERSRREAQEAREERRQREAEEAANKARNEARRQAAAEERRPEQAHPSYTKDYSRVSAALYNKKHAADINDGQRMAAQKHLASRDRKKTPVRQGSFYESPDMIPRRDPLATDGFQR